MNPHTKTHRTLLQLLLCGGMCLACEGRVVHCYEPGPWQPAHCGDPCDAPADARTNSLDSFIDTLRCDTTDKVWWDDSCSETGQATLEIQGSVAQGFCVMSCLADMQPNTPERDIACGQSAFLYDPIVNPSPRPELVACGQSDGEWIVPQGEDACLAVATGPVGAFDALPSWCREQGGHTAFVVVGDISAIGPEYTEIDLQCQFQIYRDDVCPGDELPDESCGN